MVGMILTTWWVALNILMVALNIPMVGMILTSCFKYTYGWYDIN